jgi:hypothetical protein
MMEYSSDQLLVGELQKNYENCRLSGDVDLIYPG